VFLTVEALPLQEGGAESIPADRVVHGCPELHPVGALRALHLAVEVWGRRSIRAELDLTLPKRDLAPEADELGTAIGLHPLDREGELFENPDPGTVVDGRDLVDSLPDLAVIDLDPIPW